jgi:hypothetical protein
MNEEQNRLIEEQFNTLSKSLQRAIAVSPWRASIQEIAKSQNLTEEQSEALERETMFILYGFEPATDYIGNLVQEVGLTQELAEKVAEEAGDKIFEPIIDKEEELSKAELNGEPTNPGDYMLEETKQEEKLEPMETQSTELEIPPESHLQTIPPETVHETLAPEPAGPINVIDEKGDIERPHDEPVEKSSIRQANIYPEGADPYREPLE